jgi:hypothetical protein
MSGCRSLASFVLAESWRVFPRLAVFPRMCSIRCTIFFVELCSRWFCATETEVQSLLA